MMYMVSYTGEAVVHADDEEQARADLSEYLDEVPMGNYEITNIKELD